VAREPEASVVRLIHEIYGGSVMRTPDWLMRPGRRECGRRWRLVDSIYNHLTGLELPDEMPEHEWRKVDAVFEKRGRPPLILEVDERQHFNHYRALTLERYPRSVRVAFPLKVWIERSWRRKPSSGGRASRPCPPLFPDPGGRHQQRAFRDALADLLPQLYGWMPTLRIADFEVNGWIHAPDAKRAMRTLLKTRLT
jgi:hypothetical protein